MAAGLLNERVACGRLDRPPRAGCYIDLPADFGRRFAIFCDTEEEFDWGKPVSRDNRQTGHMRSLHLIHRRLRARGVKPVYLVDHPISTDPASIAILREWLERGECTIGTQLHPWVNPPFDEEVNVYNSFVGNLPRDLERAKLLCLTEAIESAFGVRPTVYRAGRYGVGPNSAELLREAGYRADVSVRALFDYGEEGGPDFGAVRPLPFRVGDGHILEVPLSAAYVGRLRGRGRRLYPASGRLPLARGLLARAGLLNRVPLTPEGTPLAEALAAIDCLAADGVRLFSLSFHSPSVEPGHTPYVRSEAELSDFFAWWDGVLDRFDALGVTPATFEEILAAADRGPEGEAGAAAAAPLSDEAVTAQGPVAQR